MNVSVDQSRKHGGVAQVDHLGSRRNLETRGRPNIGYPIASDEHDLIGEISSGLRIEHPAGSNGNNLTLRSLGPQSSGPLRAQQKGQTNDRQQRSLETHI